MNKDLKAHLIETLEKGIRFDRRKLDEFREIVIEQDVIKTAEGSARVKIGNTEVLAGIKMELGSPYPDSPDQGTMMVNAELVPMSSPEFESGPPSIKSIEMARVVDRGIRESKTIDVKKLLIEKGEKCWIVGIDVVPINDDGNLMDAFSIATLAALKTTRFPEYKDGAVDYKKKTDKKLELTRAPIGVTVIKIGNNFVVDPTPEEENALDARLTVTSTEDGNLCALQKGGDVELSTDEIDKMIDIGIKKAKEIRALLK